MDDTLPETTRCICLNQILAAAVSRTSQSRGGAICLGAPLAVNPESWCDPAVACAEAFSLSEEGRFEEHTRGPDPRPGPGPGERPRPGAPHARRLRRAGLCGRFAPQHRAAP